MIRIRLTEDGVQMDGHAGFAVRGQDIVCAAASILLMALAGELQRLEYLGLCEHVDIFMKQGYAEIRCKFPDGEDGLAAAEALEYFCTGAALLAEHYPDYVEVCS